MIFVACQEKTIRVPADLEGFEILQIPGSEAQEAILYNGELVRERGVIRDGVKQGTWVTYHNGKDYPEVVANYVDGQLNGSYFKFNNRGQLILSTSCLNGGFDGRYVEFANTRISKQQTLVGGKIHGLAVDYYTSGKKRSEVNYEHGVLHGKSTYYNEQEEVSQEYTYEKGEMKSE
jgi:antitoxin component YwqK of YwqJK toxin-antitoxin module